MIPRARSVFFTTSFVGLHCWPEAPEEVFYLRTPHRHVFHVRVDMAVDHDDRDIEFIMVKSRLTRWLHTMPEDLGTASCETMCDRIRNFVDTAYGASGRPLLEPTQPVVVRVEVSEDGENGAVLQVV